jgi:SAM-dependent methyltransferase
MRIGTNPSPTAERFRALAAEWEAPDVLELGTLRWGAEPTHHRDWVPHAATYVLSDMSEGPDVDVAVDAHHLHDAFAAQSFDLVVAVSVWEHLAHPWVAAEQVWEVLRPGGLALIATHHAFPVHGYPDDYGRWTVNGLAALMEWSGLTTEVCEFQYPCQIVPPPEVTRWNPGAAAFLNVEGLWRR